MRIGITIIDINFYVFGVSTVASMLFRPGENAIDGFISTNGNIVPGLRGCQIDGTIIRIWSTKPNVIIIVDSFCHSHAVCSFESYVITGGIYIQISSSSRHLDAIVFYNG